MRNIVRLALRVITLAVLLLQTSLSGDAQKSNTPASAADLQFTSGRSASRIPFEFVGNHIYVRARINDSEPFWFLFDTGATASYFDVQRAKALGLGGQDNAIKGVSLALPGVRLLNQNFSLQPTISSTVSW